MSSYCVIEIKAIEPLKMGAGGNKANQTEPSKSYISGSAIRGAIISKLIKIGKFETNKKAILSKIFFQNAYPYDCSKLYTPTPNHLRMCKHEWRKEKLKKGAEIDINDLSLKIEGNSKVNSIGFEFISVKQGLKDQENKLEGLNVEKEYRLHHSKVKDDSNLFRYQAISKGKIFRSFVKYDESLKGILDSLFDDEKTIDAYIGGSKGSGYGRVTIKMIDNHIELFSMAAQKLGLIRDRKKGSKKLVIRCLSDCIFRDEFGQSQNEFPREKIEKHFGKIKKISSRFIKSGLSEGYNTKWGMRYPKEATLKAGSILVYELEKEVKEEKIIEFEEQLYGQRAVDGYGWVSANEIFSGKLVVHATKDETDSIRNEANKENRKVGDLKEVKGFETIVRGLENVKQRWLNTLYFSVEAKEHRENENATNEEDVKIKNSISQNYHLQNMLNLLKISDSNSIDENRIRDYMKDSKKFSVENINFYVILRYLVGGDIDLENKKKLDKFANEKLKTGKGKIFYLNDTDAKKSFIKDLTRTSLNINKKGREKSE
ncbi:MAG: hypothetical protein COA82_03325 [Alkaliphilus sp.]|nr:hypothetical protein [bacterium AH-315-E09]PHS35837.1 MAG: hypothetical protein COA82_03325 [Alkaliphilus sp.]